MFGIAAGLAVVLCAQAGAEEGGSMTAGMKQHTALCPAELIAHARANAERYDWAASARKTIVDAVEPWLRMSDDDIWSLPFGPNITRSWMVWSDGYCPACKNDVRMYAWEIDPFARPWKVRCPQCKEVFPKNDFGAFYRSGLDEQGIFQPARADRSLLFNIDHPDPQDPLHLFGVDDGEGFLAEGHRWRFIGCYLIYGQWKKLIVNGAANLSAAYAVTGEPAYATKAAILLDRVADVFPSYEFSKQGEVYEDPKLARGQVCQWHDACEEDRELVLAYDRIFEGARAQEKELVAFLASQAEKHKLANPKRAWADIQRNIEENIFINTLNHRERIESNYPTTDVTILTIKAVLAWPNNREEIFQLLDGIIDKSTAVDGLSGEKGLDGYGRIAPNTVAVLLARFSRLEPTFLKTVYDRHPVLHQTYRFHIDTWCMDEWYPRTGDTGTFGMKNPNYAGVPFSKAVNLNPSMAAFLWDLYDLTKDPAFVQVMYKANGGTVDGLPYDLFAEDPSGFQKRVRETIDKAGVVIPRASINKEAWRLAILRSGQAEHARAMWLDYDSGERHGHYDGLNLGLYAKGLDLMPDFGYPPVGYGGWGAPKALWYRATAAHNTVVVDGKNQPAGNGKATLWADGKWFHAVRASAPELAGCEEFERTVAMVDLDDKDSYLIDCFYVIGGRDHAKFFHSSFGAVTTQGLELKESAPYGHDTEMRNFRADTAPKPGWTADWRIEDHYGYLPKDREVRLRYTDLTAGASASLAEAWIETTEYGQGKSTWIPRLMTRRITENTPLRSIFVSVIEPYEGEPRLRSIKRLRLETVNGQPLPEEYVGIELVRSDGRRDVCMLVDGRGPGEAVEPASDIDFRGGLALITFGQSGVERMVLCNVERIRVKTLHLASPRVIPFAELALGPGGIEVLSGPADLAISATRENTPVPIQRGAAGRAAGS